MAESESAFVNRAATIGQILGSRFQPRANLTQRNPMEVHDLEGDTGRLLWAAYDHDGAAAAVDVLVAYEAAYNAARAENGLPLLTVWTVRDTLGRALNTRASDEQIAEIRHEYITRWGIKHRDGQDYDDHGRNDPSDDKESA